MHINVSGMVIPLAKPTQRWLYNVASSGYFGGLVTATTAILGAGYVAASSGIGKHKSRAGQMPFDCDHPLVFVKTVSSVGAQHGWSAILCWFFGWIMVDS